MPLIFGRTTDDKMLAILVDSTGKILGSVVVSSLPSLPAGDNNIGNVDVVTLPSLPAGDNLIGEILSRSKGWFSSAWQKDPLRFGYSAGVYRSVINLSLPAGTSNQDDSVVPAGEIWVINNLAFAYNGTVPTRLDVIIVSGAASYILYTQSAPVSGVYYDRQGAWVLSPGDFLRITLTGATLNDDLRFFAVGYRVDVDQ